MSVLNSWQKIDRVLSGRPFGDARGGNATISSGTNSYSQCTGSINTNTLSLTSAVLNNGDLFVIHQTQGTGASQWEINRVASGGGTTTITTQAPLKYAYVTGAQVIKFVPYGNLTINAHGVTEWNSGKGGIGIYCGKNVTIAQAVASEGNDGTAATPNGSGGAGDGFNGGSGNGQGGTAYQGESYIGAGAQSSNGNGTGGGGANNGSNNTATGGGGGGHATSGANGTTGTGIAVGQGGGTGGSADLTGMIFGGGGGGGARNNSNPTTGGGAGGGILIIFGESITLSAALSVDGGDGGGYTSAGTGGGGAGGSILLVCNRATLGTNNAHALGGAGGSDGGFNVGQGGAGGVGRIAVHHSGTVTGTTNPTFTDVTDNSLWESAGASLLSLIG